MTAAYRYLMLGLAVTCIAGPALADTTTAESSRPQVVSPYWNQPQFNPQFNPGYTPSPVAGEPLVEKTVMAVPQARADAVVAKWTYRKIEHQLNLTADFLRNDFRGSEEYAKAVADFNDAYAALEVARRNAVRNLVGTPEYQSIAGLRNDVNEQIADEKEAKKPDSEKLSVLAGLKLDYITPVRAAEIDLLSDDPAVRDAKTRLLEAARAVTALEKEFSVRVRDSIELNSLRKSREDAKITMLASSAYLDEVRRARDIAIQYSLTSQFGYGYDRYRGSLSASPGYRFGSYGYGGYVGGYYGGGVSTGGGDFRVGYTGNSPFGAGSNAFFGRSGNAFVGPAAGAQNK